MFGIANIHIACLVLGLLYLGNIAYWLEALVSFLRHRHETLNLHAIEGISDVQAPHVTVVVPIRDEEEHVETALVSLLEQDYLNYSVIAVDDRSTDRTPAILDELCRRCQRLTVIHVTELPPKWLGKCHAMHIGQQSAPGEYILFTDADVEFKPTALSKAMRLMTDKQLDHLTAIPFIDAQGLLSKAMLAGFFSLFSLSMRIWQVYHPSGRGFAGLGAFNLVRANAYRRSGGHERLRLEVLDDIALGQQLRSQGFNQRVAVGLDELEVPWSQTVSDMRSVLTKNLFAAVGYSVGRAVLSMVLLLILFWVPFVGLLFPEQPLFLGAAIVNVGLILLFFAAAISWYPFWYGLLIPITGTIFVYMQFYSMVHALRQGGIKWRDTFYPLKLLRENMSFKRRIVY